MGGGGEDDVEKVGRTSGKNPDYAPAKAKVLLVFFLASKIFFSVAHSFENRF